MAGKTIYFNRQELGDLIEALYLAINATSYTEKPDIDCGEYYDDDNYVAQKKAEIERYYKLSDKLKNAYHNKP